MDLFIETPRDVTERLAREQQREIEALRAASAAQQAEAQMLWQRQARMHQEQARRAGARPTQMEVGRFSAAAGADGAQRAPVWGAAYAADGKTAVDAARTASFAMDGAPDPVIPRGRPQACGAGASAVFGPSLATGGAGFAVAGPARADGGGGAPCASPAPAGDAPEFTVAPMGSGTGGSLPTNAHDAYAAERAYDAARRRRARAASVARVALAVVLAPIVLFAVFLAAYALTCVLNGASPDELGPLMRDALGHTVSFAQQALSSGVPL